MFQKELYSGNPNVIVWLVLRKHLHLEAYKLSSVQDVERWTVCTPLSVNVSVTLTTQQHLEYHCEALSETPCITSRSHNEP
jgi:hypothetical protein